VRIIKATPLDSLVRVQLVNIYNEPINVGGMANTNNGLIKKKVKKCNDKTKKETKVGT
jgi:hypothetical protein